MTNHERAVMAAHQKVCEIQKEITEHLRRRDWKAFDAAEKRLMQARVELERAERESVK